GHRGDPRGAGLATAGGHAVRNDPGGCLVSRREAMSDVATLGLGTTQSALPAILVLLVAAGGGWLGAWLVRRHALNLGLVQLPNHRSSHQVPTPTGGGIGIVIGVTAAGLLAGFMGLIAWRWPLTLALALPLAAVGFID